ncbi:carboxypeptidase-like regulatory domain-containing protein [Streptomyces sp. NPDC006393]|uniref:MSCRAMM family protein n=1 Tax=Streptomyces sp. NPDC006393 TaxID=3156763 RepID=UPI0034100937
MSPVAPQAPAPPAEAGAATPSPAPSPRRSAAATPPRQADPASGRSCGPLRGRVRDGTGRPLAHATLTLVDHRGHQRDLARSAEDGTYTLAEPEPGAYTLVVSAEGHRPRAERIVAGSGPVFSEVTLAGAGGVHGTVRHEHTGRPVPDARVTLLNERGDVVASATTATDGTYTLRNLAPGAYTVVATGYPPVAAEVALGDGGAHRVDLQVGHTPG